MFKQKIIIKLIGEGRKESDNIYEAILTVLKRIIVIAAIVCAIIMIALVVHFLL